VVIDPTFLIVTGGSKQRRPSNKTFIQHSWRNELVSGPDLKNTRKSHSCSRIRKNTTHPSSFSVIVVGGEGKNDSDILSSVEILDEGENSWRDGPDLPFGIAGAALIEDPTGGVILIGGRSSTNSYLDSLYRLAHAGEDAHWVKLPQTLEVGKYRPTATLVPDSIANCTFF
jgi:hypothetical protein